MKILVSCYACSPYRGSEPGMGWNFVQQAARYHELYILVESKFKEDLEQYFSQHPEEQINKHFYYITKARHKLLRKIWPPSYYWFYKSWQKKAYRKALELDASLNFALVHQLNMVGYREPGYLWRMGKPMVWGPIGGFNITAWNMLASMGWKGFVFYLSRNLLNLWQMHFNFRVKTAMAKSSALIAATQNEANTIKRLYGRDSVIIPEVGFSGKETSFVSHPKTGALKIAWSGQFTPGKSLNLLLEALEHTTSRTELHVIGDGECATRWKKMASRNQRVQTHWYGWVERSRAVEIMQSCDLFCITSLSDLTSTVLLEALSNGLPVIALDHCGFSNVITDECGIKIPIRNKRQVVHDIAQAIDKINSDETLRLRLSEGAHHRALEYFWDEKGKAINQIYNNMIGYSTNHFVDV